MRILLPVMTLGLLLAACRASPDASPDALAEAPPEEALAPGIPDRADTQARFRATMDYALAERLAQRPFGEMMIALGERFLNRPYVVGPLDGFGREVLVARLDAFDCFTFVEAILAMARGIAENDTTFEGYLRRTEQQRYREGRMVDYCSRLHYFTDWIHTNAGRGLLRDITAEVGGEPFDMHFGFMTAHRERYPALADEATFQCIRDVENRLNATIRLYYIPQERIAQAYPLLRPGDILSMSSNIDGLDVTHTGLAFPNGDGTFGLLHASTQGGVIVSPDLQAYVQGIRAQSGIIVARALDPRRQARAGS